VRAVECIVEISHKQKKQQLRPASNFLQIKTPRDGFGILIKITSA
jgi:hypothetical protein